MRSLILGAVAAIAVVSFAGAVQADTFSMDANGRCHDAKGHVVHSNRCTPHRDVVCKTGKPCGPTCIPKNHVCRRR